MAQTREQYQALLAEGFSTRYTMQQWPRIMYGPHGEPHKNAADAAEAQALMAQGYTFDFERIP